MPERLREGLRRGAALLEGTWTRYNDEHGDLSAAAVAFYSLLSIAPLAVIAVSVASVVFDRQSVRNALLHQVKDVANADIAHVLLRLLDAAQHAGGGLAALFALITLFWAASKVFLQLQEALNLIWGVRVSRAKSTRETIRRTAGKRIASFAMVIGSGILLLALLGLQALMTGVGDLLRHFIHVEPVLDAIGVAQQAGVSLIMLTLLCALVYRLLPDAYIRWRDVLVGSAITALLVLAGTALLGLYLSQVAPAWLQGALGSVALFMIWTYYIAQVFLIGAAFTRTWACRSGAAITPAPHAELRPEAHDEEHA